MEILSSAQPPTPFYLPTLCFIMAFNRLAVIDIPKNGDPVVHKPHSFNTVFDCPLFSYLSPPCAGSGRVLIFELNHESLNLDTPSGPATILHSHIGAPKCLFEQHAQPGVRLSYNQDIIIPRPMAEPYDRNNFIGLYFDCRIDSKNHNLKSMPCPHTGAQRDVELDSREPLLCTSTGRQIGNHEWQDQEPDKGMVLVVPRKCTFWRKEEDNGAWLGQFTNSSRF